MSKSASWLGRFAGPVVVLVCFGSGGCVYYLDPQCNDQIKNGDETDIDCGGPDCLPCNIGDSCIGDSDCDESLCDVDDRTFVCVPLPCDNGMLDEGETDVDCGGDTPQPDGAIGCRKCSGGRTCEVAEDCFSGDCVASDNICFSLQTVEFDDAVPYPSGDKTYALFSGDMDGDGSIDLVAANEQESTLAVFLNDGDGVFTKLGPTNFTTGVYPTGGAIADFNGDGIADVVTADYMGDSVSVLLGLGGGELGAKDTYPTVLDGETSQLAVADVNGDDIPDVVAANPQAHNVSLFFGLPDGRLDPTPEIPVGIAGASEPYSVAIGDYDGDGNEDLAIAANAAGKIFVRLGNGDGTFGEEAGYPEGGTASYILIAADLDLDGNLDLACANRESDNVSVLMGRGDGTFRDPLRFSTNIQTGLQTGPYSIAVADFNLDAVPDLITANYRTSTASVLLGIGNGRFEQPAIDAGSTGLGSYGVAIGDFDDDGRPDFAVANSGSNDVWVKFSAAN